MAPPVGIDEVAVLVQPVEHDKVDGVANVSVGVGSTVGLSFLQAESRHRNATVKIIELIFVFFIVCVLVNDCLVL